MIKDRKELVCVSQALDILQLKSLGERQFYLKKQMY